MWPALQNRDIWMRRSVHDAACQLSLKLMCHHACMCCAGALWVPSEQGEPGAQAHHVARSARCAAPAAACNIHTSTISSTQPSHLCPHCDTLPSACKAPPSWAESLQTLRMAATWQSATSWQRLTTTLAWLIQSQYTNRWVVLTGGRLASAAEHVSGIAMRKWQKNGSACETVDGGRGPG